MRYKDMLKLFTGQPKGRGRRGFTIVIHRRLATSSRPMKLIVIQGNLVVTGDSFPLYELSNAVSMREDVSLGP